MTRDEILALARQALEDDERATPGPWAVDAVQGEIALICVPPPGLVTPWGENDNLGRRSTNYRAIAAARTREPQLAHWIVAVLGAESGEPWYTTGHADIDAGRTVSTYGPKIARALAAALLRAADEAEQGEGQDRPHLPRR